MYRDVPGLTQDLPGMYLDVPGCTGLHWDALGCTGIFRGIPGRALCPCKIRRPKCPYGHLPGNPVTSRPLPSTSRALPGYLPGLSRGRPPRHRRLSPARIPYGHPDSPGLSRGTARTLPGHPTYSTGAGTRPTGQRYGSSGNCGERQDAAGLPGPPPSSPRREGESGENGLESALLPSDGCQPLATSASAVQGRPPCMGRRERESGEICAETAVCPLWRA